MTENEISTIIIGLAIEIHKALGPGLLENAYQRMFIIIKLNNVDFLLKKKKRCH